MMLPVRFVALAVAILAPAAHASNATTPLDYTRRNTPFAAQPTITPEKSSPATNRTLQDARVEKDVRAKEEAAVGSRRAAIDVTEAAAKQVVEKESERPRSVEQPKNAMNQRRAAISTASDTRKPPTVARYQESLTAASATNMARFPAIDAGAKATINRFVFRKNAPDSLPAAPQGAATPAAGGSPPVQR